MSKIKLFDNPMSIIEKMSEGNPGAMAFCFEALKEPADLHILLMCDTLGLYGAKLYMLWNDCCNRDMEKVRKVITEFTSGKLTREEIHKNLDCVYGQPFDFLEEREDSSATQP